MVHVTDGDKMDKSELHVMLFNRHYCRLRKGKMLTVIISQVHFIPVVLFR